MSDTLTLVAADDADTARIGAIVASHLQPGDLVLLDGDLGAGKTALARAIIRARSGDETIEVPSPTFLLVLPYQADGATILHADLYRLAGSADLDELGLADDADAIVLVEWPDRAPELAAQADLVVKLEIPAGGEGRRIGLMIPRDEARHAQLATALSAFAA